MKKRFNIGLKIQIVIGSILLITSIFAVIWLNGKFQQQMEDTTKQKAQEIAVMSLNTLNMFMLTGLISDEANRKLFYEKTKASEDIVDFRVFRSQKVIEQYGAGLDIEAPKDPLDKSVLDKGEMIIDHLSQDGKDMIRIVYPYKATKDFRGTNCMSCHIANEGDTLGATSITIDITQATQSISKTIQMLWVMSFILLFLVMFFIYLASKKYISNPLIEFEKGLVSFFAYLNREKETIEPIKIDSTDEIAVMSHFVNKNIRHIEKTMEEDKALILDAKHVISRVKNGWYSQYIDKKTSNRSLEEFKNDVNHMIKSTYERFVKINMILEEYSKNNYIEKLQLAPDDEKDGVFEKVICGMNTVQKTITEILVENKNTGITLQNSATHLLDNISILEESSNDTMIKLDDTTIALKELTSIVDGTTTKISQIADLSQMVTQSAKTGQELAQKTALSMEEIASQVALINEAIAIIDQIAFQTNILSLNAAVEAATAGEAGKGFAVVAGEVRNLANRSSEAAKEIKDLVESATNKSLEGKEIASEMILGYEGLTSHIDKTIDLIENVNEDAQKQQQGIIKINETVDILDQKTHQNTKIATTTHDIAINTSKLANELVGNANQKEFIGK